MSLLTIGIGTYQGNDQLGLYVVKKLESNWACYPHPSIQFCICTDTGATLLNVMQGFKTVYLVDGVKSGAQMGKIFHLENGDITDISDSISSHTIGLTDTLKLGQVLDMLPQRVVFYGMELGGEAIAWHAAEENRHITNFMTYIKEAITAGIKP
jgi:hydrogenase maturation protease